MTRHVIIEVVSGKQFTATKVTLTLIGNQWQITGIDDFSCNGLVNALKVGRGEALMIEDGDTFVSTQTQHKLDQMRNNKEAYLVHGAPFGMQYWLFDSNYELDI